MNLNNIETGMVVKNYKEMCSLLEEDSLAGNSKVSQLKEWERYFDYDKQGHKFVINEVYAQPLPKDFSENDIYTKYIQVILTQYLKINGSGNFTTKQLLKLCGFVNDNWDDESLLAEYTQTHDCTYGQAKYYYNQLYQHVYAYCSTALKRCLDRLANRGFLRWNKKLWIQKEDDIEMSEATQEEIQQYLNMTCSAREELGIKYVNIYNRKEYYKRVEEKFCENGWIAAYDLIEIIYAPDFIDKVIDESKAELIDSLKSVNSHCLSQMYKYIDADIEKDIKKLSAKMDGDMEMARLCMDVDMAKKNKFDITDMFVAI